MNILTLLIYILLSMTSLDRYDLINSKEALISTDYTFISTCPDSSDRNRTIIENFVTGSDWSTERAETNTNGLSISQITLLTDSNYSSKCATLNEVYQETRNETNSFGESLRNVTYYKVGSFYIVIITIRQPSNDGYAISGTNYLNIYNQNLEPIQGYAF